MAADVQLMGYLAATATLVKANAPDARELVATQLARIEAIACRFTDLAAGERFRHRLPWNAAMYRLHATLG